MKTLMMGLFLMCTTVLAAAPGAEEFSRVLDLKQAYAELASRREVHLQRLKSYADAGVFPKNYDFPGRYQPYFVDRHNTACAVGHLMRCSGDAQLVAQIAQNDNHVRIMDIHDGPALDWMLRSGLTQAECALIQPSYSYPDAVSSEYVTKIDKEKERLRTHFAAVEKKLRAETTYSLQTALKSLIGQEIAAGNLNRSHVPALLTALEDEEPNVRIGAAFALEKLLDKKDARKLAAASGKCLDAADAQSRFWCAAALLEPGLAAREPAVANRCATVLLDAIKTEKDNNLKGVAVQRLASIAPQVLQHGSYRPSFAYDIVPALKSAAGKEPLFRTFPGNMWVSAAGNPKRSKDEISVTHVQVKATAEYINFLKGELDKARSYDASHGVRLVAQEALAAMDWVPNSFKDSNLQRDVTQHAELIRQAADLSFYGRKFFHGFQPDQKFAGRNVDIMRDFSGTDSLVLADSAESARAMADKHVAALNKLPGHLRPSDGMQYEIQSSESSELYHAFRIHSKRHPDVEQWAVVLRPALFERAKGSLFGLHDSALRYTAHKGSIEIGTASELIVSTSVRSDLEQFAAGVDLLAYIVLQRNPYRLLSRTTQSSEKTFTWTGVLAREGQPLEKLELEQLKIVADKQSGRLMVSQSGLK